MTVGARPPAHPLLTDEGRAALTAATDEPDPDSLAAATRLRKRFSPELAAAALGQVALRRRARAKFGDQADQIWFTADGLEQASRPEVAAWRASRLAAAGVCRVIDLGCGIGADARGFLAAGLAVTAVELDPDTAALAQANLSGAEVLVGDATEVASRLLADADPATAVFVDPSRRTPRGRSWRVDDFQPRWSFVLGLLGSGHPVCVKLGPGLPRELIPAGVEACWVSHHGDVVETGLWRLGHAPGGYGGMAAAVLLPGGHRLEFRAEPGRLPVRPVGRYLLEPDGAVIRARALDRIHPRAWLLDAAVAYLSCDEPVDSPFATCFEVLQTLDADEKSLRAWVRANRVGVLEIKKRAIDVDPAALRRRLRPSGPNRATIVLARTTEGARALVVRRHQTGASGTRLV